MEVLVKSVSKWLDISPVIRFINDHRILSTCATVSLLYGAWFLKRPRNLPPGPWGYPLVGSLVSLSKTPDMGCSEFAKKYGNVFCLWLGGNRYWIILHGYEAIKEAYTTHGADFMNRDLDRLMEFFGQDDTIFTSQYGETYKLSRKVASQGMRTVLNNQLPIMIEDDLNQVEEALEGDLGKPVDLLPQIKSIFTNCMMGIVLGKSYQHKDEEFIQLREDLESWGYHLFECLSQLTLPYDPRKWFISSKLATTRREADEIREFVERFVNKREQNSSDGEVRCIIDAYLQCKGPINFTKKKIASTMLSFLPDTVVTSVDLMLWVIVYLVNHPDSQRQIFDEVQKVCGSEGVSLRKRPEMPVTESFIMEVFRIVNPIQFGVQGKPVKATTFRGYNIPEYAVVSAHYGGAHTDPEIFPEPEIFKPMRFVKDGKIGNTQGFLPFGMGRRMCMGEPFVRSVTFYITARLVSRYQLYSPDGGKLSIKREVEGIIPKPSSFEVVMKKRQC